MANTLNNLVPDLYEALDVISREMTGFIPAVSRDSSVARAAIGQDVLVPITTEAAAADNTPGVTAPDIERQVEQVEALVSGWGFDDKLSPESIRALVETSAGAAEAIVKAYQQAFNTARLGN